MTDAVLEVHDLVVTYGHVAAVRGVSFSVDAGGLVTVIGANGAGKSSTLGAVSGLVRPTSGSVVFQGKDVTRWPAHRLVAEGLVQVPEGREILGSLTVEENLQLGGWHQGSAAATTIAEMYERFPILAERRTLSAGSLSGGEQQMLAIARALVARPSLLLLDEPSMGLAPKLVDEVFEVIEGIRAAGTTVLLVEQNANQALRSADYGYVLETGEVVHEGRASDLLSDERVVSAYLGLT